MRRFYALPDGDGWPAMEEDTDGDYVLVEEVSALVQRAQEGDMEALQELEALC